jgi:hypothetical protein
MAKQKSNIKTTGKKSSVTTEKAKQTPRKRVTKAMPIKRSGSPSKNKKPTSKDARPEKLFKERLESLNAGIDFIQNTLNSADMDTDKVKDVFKNVFGDITSFLKLFPKIKSNELLTSYNKILKKIESFMNSIRFGLENENIFSANNAIKAFGPNEKNVLIKKMKDKDDNFFFIKEYLEDKTPDILFSNNGKLVNFSNFKPDVTFDKVKVNIDRVEILVDVINNNKNNYILIESTMINKELYYSYLGADFDTTNNEKGELVVRNNIPFDLTVINLLFENQKLRNRLLKLEDKKNIDITLGNL